MHATLDRPTRIPHAYFDFMAALGGVPEPDPRPVRTVADVKALVKSWVRSVRGSIPDLVGAHLTGGITAMPDDAPFPSGKDVDLHLVVDECSPALDPTPGAFFPILEVDLDGIPLEAGIKGASDYANPEAVLANPEIAYHLTRDTILFDPLGILTGLQDAVGRDYARREWVLARLEHERDGLAGAMAMLPMARAMSGPSGELNILGYTTTFLTAALQVATLSPPRMGGRTLVHLREQLHRLGKPELHEEVLAILGLRSITADQARAVLDEAAELFDRAVAARVTPHLFQHKLHPHQRDYFLDACRAMIAEGFHREALGWTLPFHMSCTDILLVDGPEHDRPAIEARRAALLRLLDRETPESQAAAIDRAVQVQGTIFALAERVISGHPDIRD